MFGSGTATGYLTRKYRQEIFSITRKTSGQSRDFIVRQKKNLKDLLAESQGVVESGDVSQ
jgi:hypothetical protein